MTLSHFSIEGNTVIGDTETTGFPKNGPKQQDGQARVIQLAAILAAPDGTHWTEFKTLIKPDGWTISPGAEAVHGISLEMCEKFGVPIKVALEMFDKVVRQSGLVVFHNEAFDWGKMLAIEYDYCGMEMPQVETFCTMQASTDLCKIPGRYGNYKWPKLSEALPILCGKELGKDAHDAMVDTKGCKDLFFELKRRHLAEVGAAA